MIVMGATFFWVRARDQRSTLEVLFRLLLQWRDVQEWGIPENQDEEFLCLTNQNGYAVDVSGWKMEGGITHRLRAGTVIPAGGSLYLSPNVAAFRSRTTAPRGGMGLFVQGNYDGHLNAWGETLTLTDASGRIVSRTNFTGAPSLAQQYLRITEIMYNPADPNCEYIELQNIGTQPINLNLVKFTNGVDVTFGDVTLAPNAYTLVVQNAAEFAKRYGAGLPIAGQYFGLLENKGERIQLVDATH